MPLVNVRVDDATRALWVEAAGGEMLTLSEWIRKACDTRLGLADRYVDKPLRLDVEQPVGEIAAATAPAGATGPSEPDSAPSAPTGTTPPAVSAQAAADALSRVAYPEREFKGPDLKPEPKKKKR